MLICLTVAFYAALLHRSK